MFYYFFKTFTRPWVAFGAAFIIAVSEYLMVFSCIGYNNTHALLAMGAALATTARAIKSGRPFAFVAAGMGLAFCFYVFPAGIYAVPIVLWLALLYRPPRNRSEFAHWGIYLGTMLVFILPLFFQPDYWESKIIGTVLARSAEIPDSTFLMGRIATQFGYAFWSFLFAVQESHYVRVSYMDAISGGLVLIGLPVLIWRVRADKFALYVLTSLLAIVFLAGATHSAPAPPTTRMFLTVPFFALTAIFGLQWLSFQFGGWFRTVPVRRFSLAGFLVVILGINLYQAYDTSARPPNGFLEFDALFVRLAQNLNTMSPTASHAIGFVYNPSRHFVPALQRQLDVDYLPVEVRGIDVTRRQPSVMERQMRSPDNVIVLSPYLESAQQQAFEQYLREHRWRECSMLSTGGQKRIGVWYAPDQANPYVDPPTDRPTRLPDAGILFLVGLVLASGFAGMVLVERRGSAGLPVVNSVRLKKGSSTEPTSPRQSSAVALVPPHSAANSAHDVTWEFSVRLTLRLTKDVRTPRGDADHPPSPPANTGDENPE